MSYVNRSRGFLVLFVFIIASLAARAGAQTYFVDITCVYKGDKYFYSQKTVLNKLKTYDGYIKNDAGREREIIFNATLGKRKSESNFLLQYQFELAELKGGSLSPLKKMSGAKSFFKQSKPKQKSNPKPPLQLQADIMIPLNKKLLVGHGNDWKVYIKLRRKGNDKKPEGPIGDYQIISEIFYYGKTFPIKLVGKQGSQMSYVGNIFISGALHKFILSIYTSRLSVNNNFNLQYNLRITADDKRAVSARGKTNLFPGAKSKIIAKGKNWKYSLRGLKF